MLATPPLEASDEYKHYPVVQHIQTTWTLPVADPENPGLWLQEAAQPPLYYAVMAAATAWIDTSDLQQLHQLNPHAFIGNPNQVDNKNLIIHEPEREAFPWTGSVLAIYVIRVLSIAFGLGTIWVTARLGLLLFGQWVGLLAAALTAFNPMFLFVHAAVNNDSLAILLGSLGLFLLVGLWRRPADQRSWQQIAVLGIVLGLGTLTKLSLLGLLGLSVLALALLAWQQRKLRFFVQGTALLLAGVLVVAGWWFLRNWRLYGDPTALRAFVAVQGSRESPITWQDWLGESGTLYRSFWGLFGGVNVPAPELYYAFCNAMVIVATVGVFLWLWRARGQTPAGFWLLPAWALLVFVALIRWNITSTAFQGRLLFPALGALNVLWALGLLAWLRREWQPALAAGVATALLAAAAIMPWVAIRPAYAYPMPLDTVPEQARFGPVTFASGESATPSREAIRLVGVELEPGQEVLPNGAPVKLALYWEAVEPTEQDLVTSVHLLGPGYESMGRINRYPASGMIPTSQWMAGQIWRDIYHVPVDTNPANPVRLLVSPGVYDAKADRPLLANSPDGESISLLTVGESRLTPIREEPLQPFVPLAVALDDGISFLGYDLVPSAHPGDVLPLTLYWEARSKPSLDYTVFVHLVDETGNQVAGADGPPVGGDSPTSWWRSGDQIADTHEMKLPAGMPPGDYRIVVGLYDPGSGQRLMRADDQGDAFTLDLPVTLP
jgi:4-amino-4-deoxy-L-arabinose transferase-like glycosyltransferase